MLSPEGEISVDGSDVGTQLSLIVGAYVAWMNVANNTVQNEDEVWKYCDKFGSIQSLNMAKVEIKFNCVLVLFFLVSGVASINKEKSSAT